YLATISAVCRLASFDCPDQSPLSSNAEITVSCEQPAKQCKSTTPSLVVVICNDGFRSLCAGQLAMKSCGRPLPFSARNSSRLLGLVWLDVVIGFLLR